VTVSVGFMRNVLWCNHLNIAVNAARGVAPMG
jgi:hypothetical protein